MRRGFSGDSQVHIRELGRISNRLLPASWLNATLLNVLFTRGKRVPARKVAASPSMAPERHCFPDWWRWNGFMASLALIGATVTRQAIAFAEKKMNGNSSGDPARLARAEEEIVLGSMVPVRFN